MEALYVYLIENSITGKGYVGCTVQSPSRRWNNHVAVARRGSDRALARSIRKHGESAFSMSVLEKHQTIAGMLDAERRWIADLGTRAPAGYNLTDGGEGTHGCVHTPMARANMSAAHIGKPGRPHTPESRAAMRKPHRKMIGPRMPRSPESNAKRAQTIRLRALVRRSAPLLAMLNANHARPREAVAQ